VPDPAPFRDALIGATAAANRMSVAARFARDFERFPGVAVINPWT
jgi:toxin FitB